LNTNQTKSLAAIAVLVIFSGFAYFWNLGDRLLWGDEAETALLAINITKFGLPLASDGKNTVTLYGTGKDSNQSGVWVWSPWMDEYIAAGSLAVFGKSTFAARFPFAVIGFLCVFFVPFVTYRIFKRPDAALIAMLIFATSAPMILHARQSRYYSLLVFAQLVLLFALTLTLNRRILMGGLLLVLALLIQWYNNYIVAVANAAALAALLFTMRRRRADLIKPIVAALGAFAILALPWLLYARPEGQSSLFGLHRLDKRLIYYSWCVGPYILVLGWLLFIVPRQRATGKNASPPSGDAVTHDLYRFMYLATATHLGVAFLSPGEFYRYVLPLVAMLMIFVAHAIAATPIKPTRAACLVAMLLFNAFYLVRLVPDIASKYHNTLGDVVAYLNQNAQPDDAVFVQDPAFPIIFHTGLRVVDGRIHRELDLNNLPRWILSESPGAMVTGPPLELPAPLAKKYEKVELAVHDSPKGDCRPDPDDHAWASSITMRTLTIYKRLDTAP
jgi:hypothetical protein